jgi:hypothetical protein
VRRTAHRIDTKGGAPSAALVGHFGVRLGAFGPLSRRRLALHLPLRIFG